MNNKNREIKFRVWVSKENRFLTTDSHWVGGDGMGDQSLIFGLDEEDINYVDTTEKVIIQQFTGLKDKHGCEIYEGDILNCAPRSPVAFESGYFFTEKILINKEKDIWNVALLGINAQHSKIIGNIFENPELLTAIQTDSPDNFQN